MINRLLFVCLILLFGTSPAWSANEVLFKTGASIILGDATDHNPTAGATLDGAETDQIDLTSLVAGAYRQSDKFDFTTPRGTFIVRAAFEPVSAPTAGGTVDVHIGYSNSATAANSNPGNLSGSDSAYVGYGAAAADATEALSQLEFIGSCHATADDDIMVCELGLIVPKLQYGMVVVKNGWSVNLEGDAIEMSIHFIELITEVQ
jgi:hypothetical protein